MMKIRCLSFVMALIVMMTCFVVPTQAATSAISGYAKVTSISTGKGSDSLKVRVTGKKTIKITMKSTIPAVGFKVGLAKSRTASSKEKWYKTLGTRTAKNRGMTATFKLTGVKDGQYFLVIMRARKKSQIKSVGYGDGGKCHKNITLIVSKGKVYLKKYTKIMARNKDMMNDSKYAYPSMYLDKSLEDCSICLKDPGESEAKPLTSSQRAYIKKYADKAIGNYTSDYMKAKRIYKRVATMFYYDRYAFLKRKDKQYVNPYRNLSKYLKKSNSPNSSNGKVATVCVGFSAMSIAMLRAENIPARLVYGYHVNAYELAWNSPSVKDNSVYNKPNHYWVEFYDSNDGKWKTFDANMGTSSKWERKYLSDKGSWKARGTFNSYVNFDASPEVLAEDHRIGGYYSKKLVRNSGDASKLYKFMMQNNNRIALGEYKTDLHSNAVYIRNLDKAYAEQMSGKLRLVSWENTGISGSLDFSGMSILKSLKVSDTGVTTINVSNCPQLTTIIATRSKAETLNATGCKSLEGLWTYDCPLKSARYTFNSKGSVAIIKAGEGGVVHVSFAGGKHTIWAVRDEGYNFDHWEDGNGNKVSSEWKVEKFSKSSSFTRIAIFKKKQNQNQQ